MKTNFKGYSYTLFDHNSKIYGQDLNFVKKSPNGKYVQQRGTTNEEVLNVLIDRVETLGKSDASTEALQHLKKVKILLSKTE